MKVKLRKVGLSMGAKLVLSLSAIAVTLIVTSTVTVIEFRKINDTVADLIRCDEACVKVSNDLAALVSDYGIDDIARERDGALRKLADNQRTLLANADDFRNSYYRTIIPEVVAVGAGLLLILLLLFFLLAFYVHPVNLMFNQLDAFNNGALKKYSVEFDGDDQLHNLNEEIVCLTEDNIELKRRIKALKERNSAE